MCVRTQPQSSVTPEQLLREIFRGPQKCGCFKGTSRPSQVLILLEGWGGKEAEHSLGPLGQLRPVGRWKGEPQASVSLGLG